MLASRRAPLPARHDPAPRGRHRRIRRAGGGGPPRPLAERRPPLVLVAEDHEDTRNILGEALWVAGYQVQLAADGVEALARLAATQPDLLLLDLRMPRLSGIGVLQALRKRAETLELPVIAFTAWGANEATAEALRLGCRRVVTKPTDPRTLLREVGELVAAPAPRRPTESPWSAAAHHVREPTRPLAAALEELEDRWRHWRPGSPHTPPSVLARRLLASAAAGGLADVATRARALAVLLDAAEETAETPPSPFVALAVAELREAIERTPRPKPTGDA